MFGLKNSIAFIRIFVVIVDDAHSNVIKLRLIAHRKLSHRIACVDCFKSNRIHID